MAVGFNEAIMFAFFMVIIAAFIGTQDLGEAGARLRVQISLKLCFGNVCFAHGPHF